MNSNDIQFTDWYDTNRIPLPKPLINKDHSSPHTWKISESEKYNHDIQDHSMYTWG